MTIGLDCDLDVEMKLFVLALHSSLVGFIIRAVFAPEAYQYFSYFAAAQTSVIFAMAREQDPETCSSAMPQTLLHSATARSLALRRCH
jgi:hypothetical protein